MSFFKISQLNKLVFSLFFIVSFQISAQEFRDIEGFLNNPNHYWGAAFTPVVNFSCPAYADSISSPAGPERPNARMISNNIFGKMPEINDPKGLSAYCWVWGQFIDHDITLSPDHPTESMNIKIPAFDVHFDPNGLGNVEIPMNRSDYDRNTGTTKANPRVHYNAITAFIDASAVYGSDSERAAWLRSFQSGKLKTSKGNLLPFNTIDGEFESSIDTSAPEMAMPFPHVTKFFVAGDVRANENPFLSSIHTLFIREHNRQCEIYKSKYPNWNDEQIYQKARKIVGGIIQAIVYEEWLPAMGIDIKACGGYNQWINPGLRNAFSAAAYRYGHTTITPMLMRMDNQGRVVKKGNIGLKDAFFNPNAILEVEGIDSYLNGMSTVVQQEVDCYVIDELRNFLFGAPGAGGLDLVAININRARDRGLPDFNTLRKDYGLEAYGNFNEINSDTNLIHHLSQTYQSINLIDPWVGMLAESHMPGSMFGATAKKIIEEQFTVLRQGDRYYYEFDPYLTSEEIAEVKATRLSAVIRNSDAKLIPDEVFVTQSLEFLAYRTIDGTYNNEENTSWGASNSDVLHSNVTHFSDGISSPSGFDRPNPRLISNIVFAQDHSVDDQFNLSAYAWGWGQFIDHDITLSPDHPSERMDVLVPKYDVFFDPEGTGQKVIPMNRSEYDRNTGSDVNNPRRYINAITSYVDASNVYGSDKNTANWLRTFSNGKLKMSAGNLLPYNTVDGEYGSALDPSAPGMAMPMPHVKQYFVAGDVRANENPFLVTFHTLFVREHNRICEELFLINPDWSDEKLYQNARKQVGSIIQAIVYEEWLPTIGIKLEDYIGYNPNANPAIMNVFSTAAFRYGHTTINPMLVRMDNNKNVISAGNISLKDAFFNPEATRETNGIEAYMMGMSTVVQQKFDCYVIDELRNFLFGPPGAGGLDLVAININRGRDRGLIDYNSIRSEFGYSKVPNFMELSTDRILRQKLAAIYQDIDIIDPWVGMLAEDNVPGSFFGLTAKSIIEDQFSALRDGDRYYYENDTSLTLQQRSQIKKTLLSEVIKRNTTISSIQDSVFKIIQVPSKKKELKKQIVPIEISLFPNPVIDFVFIEIDQPEVLKEGGFVDIIDMNGFVIQRTRINPNSEKSEFRLDLSRSLIPGQYIIWIHNPQFTGYKAFYKDRN